MARLTLLTGERGPKKDPAPISATGGYKNAANEGEAARQLLEANGFLPRRQTAQNGQYEFNCPFHEQPGEFQRGKSTNFYLDAKTSRYYCQSATCSEKGNLLTLERYFGVEADPTRASYFKSNAARLQTYMAALTPERRKVFHDKGLTDSTIDRFKLGWDAEKSCYVIPYIENGHAAAFRFYNPNPTVRPDGKKGLKYWWEPGTEARPYNQGDGIGDQNARVFVTEGETKAMLLCQMGYNAVSVPGAGLFKPEWLQAFNNAKEIIVVFDNDNPEHHVYEDCRKCSAVGSMVCRGHNPGQEGAARTIDMLGYRARNVVLPLPQGERKVDINEYFMRDGGTKDDFAQVVFGHKNSPFVVRSLAQIMQEPPPEATFYIEQGILPVGGRLLVTGAPKAGKSIFVENLALSLASGLPFLGNFNCLKPTRTLLLDRELSARSLFDRLGSLIEARPGYSVGVDNLFIDHEMLFKLDEPDAEARLISLIQANNAEVVIFDTAYKFFSGDMESSKGVTKAFSTLDKVIAETGISVVLTHHHRKKGTQNNGKEERPDPDQVVGSFLWTGWPNATVLINFMNRRVESPFNTVASFAAFRDAAPPEPLALYRDRDSIAYKAITPFSFDDEDGPVRAERQQLTYDNLANVLLEACPVVEDDFLHMAQAVFGAKAPTIRIHLIDILDRHPDFVREGKGTRNNPYIWKYKWDKEEETFEQGWAREHGTMELGL